MSRIDSSTSTNTTGSGASKPTDLRELSMDHFLQLMITELQNQDPLDPMENSEMLQQISQIREIAATDQLRESLESMQQSQGISTASSLIGKQVQAMNNEGYVFFGVVNSVQLTPNDDGTRELTLKVNTGDQTVDVKMDDIFTILPAKASPPPTVPDDETGDDGDDTATDPDAGSDDGTDETEATTT